MINLFRRIFLRIHRWWWMNDEQYREGGVWILQRYFEQRKNNSGQFFNHFRSELQETVENDIHLLQNPHIHILKSIELANFFNLNHDNLIVDVGGFDGEVAKLFALSFPKATVLTYEPIKSNYNNILGAVSGITNVKVRNYGLGRSPQTATINKTVNLPSSSLMVVNTKIGNGFFAQNLKMEDKEEVKITTLDDEITGNQSVNILKIDVQGYEMEVLLGATETLSRTNIVLVEMQNHDFYEGAPLYHEVDSFLRSKHFMLFDLLPALRKNGKLHEWDAIYVKYSLTHN